MRGILSAMFVLAFYTFAIGQTSSEADTNVILCRNDDWKTKDYTWKKKDYRLKPATLYSETSSNGLVIQNSYPKGGAYTDLNGERFGYRVFWTRIMNETDAPVEVTISFNAFTIFPSPDSFLKLFLPSDTMTFANTLSYDYGVDLKSFLGTGFHEPTMLQKTISPGEEYFFNIGALFDHDGVARAELVVKGQDLFYRILGPQLDPALIPCGHIIFKE